MADITIDNHGSILIFRGASLEGKRWMAEHLPEDAQRWAGGIVVEPRYAGDIIDGAINDGLEVLS